MQEIGSTQTLQQINSRNSALKTDFPSSLLPPAQPEDPSSQLVLRKKKYGTKWKQQQLSAFRQDLSLFYIFTLYVSIGVLFVTVGIVTYLSASKYPKIIEKDYTHCKSTSKSDPESDIYNVSDAECFPSPQVHTQVNYSITKSIQCVCRVHIKIDEEHLPTEEESNLLLSVKLTHFHQNIRHFRKDVDWEQIRGNVMQPNGKTPRVNHCVKKKYEKKPIYPCGKLANSYFSDRFKIFNSDGIEVPLDFSRIAWQSDEPRYGKPKLEGRKITDLFDLPNDWHDNLKDEFLQEEKGVQDKHFIVWMRPAALELFRKKYAHIPSLRKEGDYTIEVQYRYEVKSYHGTKTLVIAVDSKDRPVDFFFFYWYTSVGGACLLFVPLMYLIKLTYHAFHKSSSSAKQPSQTVSEHGVASQNEIENPPSQTVQPSNVSVSVKA